MATSTAVPSPALPKVYRSHLPVIMAIAIFARVATLMVYAHKQHFPDLRHLGYEDIYIALSLESGHGFASPLGFPSGPTGLLAPGYPLLIAGGIHLVGMGMVAASVLIFFQMLVRSEEHTS